MDGILSPPPTHEPGGSAWRPVRRASVCVFLLHLPRAEFQANASTGAPSAPLVGRHESVRGAPGRTADLQPCAPLLGCLAAGERASQSLL
eukprot:CAMPEP_0195104138 /NCGR_PEP_ID=MMETSP0448-20130528/72919_1 /TAXON_ID=66468 /ORGANISM="Heterocapsa triquestra, Strain CCMP 448" /LENGTH=89 /DNA_ID=CAMNT_0040139917 /DNA_START=34 /DNA_END=300 /DNA_ORIENTATION=-